MLIASKALQKLQPTASMQKNLSTAMIILLYTLRNKIYYYLEQCYHLTIGCQKTSKALFIMVHYKLIL